MPLIEWIDDYNTGIPAIDEQHRGLVDLINAFEEASRQGRGSRVMNRTLNDLIGYTQEHFLFEEEYMEKIDYDWLDQHRAQHRQMVQKIERFQYEFIHDGRQITLEVREFLKYWLTSHIQRDDMEYAESARVKSKADEAEDADEAESATEAADPAETDAPTTPIAT